MAWLKREIEKKVNDENTTFRYDLREGYVTYKMVVCSESATLGKRGKQNTTTSNHFLYIRL